MPLKKDHLGHGNDYPDHRRIKKSAKRISSKNTRNRLKRSLERDVRENKG